MLPRNYASYAGLALLALEFTVDAHAGVFDWSNSEIQYLHGNGYRMPGNDNDIAYSIITVTHADGWALGPISSLWIR
ncbi:MAG: hypothetical protein ACXV7J_06040 [Methylomonas sp.]